MGAARMKRILHDITAPASYLDMSSLEGGHPYMAGLHHCYISWNEDPWESSAFTIANLTCSEDVSTRMPYFR